MILWTCNTRVYFVKSFKWKTTPPFKWFTNLTYVYTTYSGTPFGRHMLYEGVNYLILCLKLLHIRISEHHKKVMATHLRWTSVSSCHHSITWEQKTICKTLIYIHVLIHIASDMYLVWQLYIRWKFGMMKQVIRTTVLVCLVNIFFNYQVWKYRKKPCLKQ